MIRITDIPGRQTLVKGVPHLFFSGFAYLGMPSLEVFQDTVAEGLRRYGAVYPSSRASNTPLALYEAFERELAAFTGREAALTFSSGYAAAQAAAYGCAAGGPLLYGPGTHPSLMVAGAGGRRFTSAGWEREVLAFLGTVTTGMPTIVLESVDPISGTIRDFSWLMETPRQVRVLVDDSHGIGILGDGGEGITGMLPLLPELSYLICFSLSKAFSCQGGAVAGTSRDIGLLRAQPWFSAATPMSPAFAYAWMESRPVFDRERERLKRNLAWLREGLRDSALARHDPRLPFCRFLDPAFYAYCLSRAILLSAFRYPSPSDPLVVRAVINALHTPKDLSVLLEALHEFRPQGR
jgi:7-keto-8-aminopelargonate synthetase-like enzyme